MQEIRYKIDLNENGRPCIDLPPDYLHNQEDKFFALEITRYYLQVVFARMDRSMYDENTMRRFEDNIQFLGQMGDEMAEIIFDDMVKNGDIAMAMNEGEFNAHIYQKSIADRDALSMTHIIFNNKIFKREIGLKVFVYDENESESLDIYNDVNGIYELVGGITNEHWVKIK